MAEDSHDLFISYAHADDTDGWVTALVEAIRAEYAEFTPRPLAVFFDRGDIRTMDDWEHRILAGLRSAKVMVAVLSPAYFASAYCRKEWEVWVDHERSRALPGEGIAPIYTVTVPGFEDEAEGALDEWLADLRRRQYLDLRPWWPAGIEALHREDVRLRLEALGQQIDERLRRAERSQTSPTTIPPHNERFVGRVEELRKLRETLALGRVGAITAIHGIGGIGKSALAFEYAHAYADGYPGGRFLVPAGGYRDLRVPIVNLAPQLGVELTDEERRDLDAGFAHIRAALDRGGRSLLLIDNVDDPALLAPERRAQWLPATDNVHVLVTTRLAPDRLPGIDCLPLDSLPADDAMRLLERHRPFANDDEWEAARGIVQRLGGHALAVEIVAVYLWQNPDISCAAYLARLKREGLGALDGAGSDDLVRLSRHPQTLLGPLLEPTLAGLSEPEMLTLEYAALLPPDSVPLPWLRDLVGEEFPEATREPEPGHPDPWRRLLRRVFGLRLFTPADEPSLARIHRLVQDIVSARMSAEGTLRSALTSHAKARAEPMAAGGWLRREQRWELKPLRDHALALLAGIDGAGFVMADLVQHALRELGRYAECRDLVARTIGAKEAILPPDDASLAASYAHLGLVESLLGDFLRARRLLHRAIETQEKTLSPDHPHLAASRSHLALVEYNLGDLNKARSLLERAIAAQSRALPPDHPDIAESYARLAIVALAEGALGEAQKLLQHAIAIEEEALPPDHPNLAVRYNSLAVLQVDLGSPENARELLRRALAIEEGVFGSKHPTVATTCANLAMAEYYLGNFRAARALLRRAIVIEEEHLRTNHPLHGITHTYLMCVEERLGDLQAARDSARRAYCILRATLGRDRAETKHVRAWLALHDPEFTDRDGD